MVFDSDKIREMNGQNQNNPLGQPSGSNGLQPTAAGGQSSIAVGQQSNATPFASASNGLILNQTPVPTQVLSTTTPKPETINKAPLKTSDDFPVVGVLALLIVLVALAWFVRKKIENNR